MMTNYIEIIIPVADNEIKEILTALLSEQAFDGFEETADELKAYTTEEKFSVTPLEEILQPFNLNYTFNFIPAQNWNALWESNFQPVTVDDFVVIRAGFHKPPQKTEYEIVITPKMSFGTGHHATTFMMIQQMRKINFINKTVFDFGTGTGILSILADKLGAATVTAIDNDAWSIANAEENILNNKCEKIILHLSGTPEFAKQFDVILANINKNIILEYLGTLVSLVKENGVILLSGLLAEDEADITFEASRLRLKHLTTNTMDKWICMYFSL